MVKRNFPPGIHGIKGYGRLTGYGIQLREKQKAKRIYRLMENQFKNYFKKARKDKANTINTLIQLLEMRFDNVLYRAGFAKSRDLARQIISHNHFMVNAKSINIPSYQVKIGDIISIKEKSKSSKLFANLTEQIKKIEAVDWLAIDATKNEIKVVDKPSMEKIKGEFDPKLVVEFYSK